MERPIVLVVAHPDDEVIGVGGQLARWAPRLICVHASDGAPPDGGDARAAGFDGPSAYARTRHDESRAALARAGVASERLTRLDLPDRSLMLHLDDLHAALARLLREMSAATVITHAYEGGHPDHDALSLVLAHIVGRWPVTAGHRPHLLEFAGYHEGPAGTLVTNRFAPPAMGGERRFRLTAAQQRRKAGMLACFSTQRSTLGPFGCAEEWIRPAPPYPYTEPPNGGRVWYDRLGWEIRSSDWLAHTAAFLAAGEAVQRAEASCSRS